MFVGLDVHRKICYGTVLDDSGRVVKQGRFSNDLDSLDGFLKGLGESQAETIVRHGPRIGACPPEDTQLISGRKRDKKVTIKDHREGEFT